MTSLRLFCLLALIQGGISVTAQYILPLPVPTTNADHAQRWVVKFAPLSLVDPDNTIQFGIERLLGHRQSIQAEYGYGWQGMNLWQSSQNQRYSDREIWRGRVEWRYYLHNTNQPQGQYFAFEGFYKQVSVQESGTIGVGCSTGPCQYYQLFSSPLTKYVWGGHLKFGRQFAPQPQNNRLLADVYLGLGFRRRNVERFQQPDASYYYRSAGYTLFDSFSTAPYTLISISWGAKIGYAF